MKYHAVPRVEKLRRLTESYVYDANHPTKRKTLICSKKPCPEGWPNTHIA